MNRKTLGIVIAWVAAVIPSTFATTYYVRTSGNDSASGRYPSQAWRSLTQAAKLAQAGDTIIVGAGVYDGKIRIRGKSDTTNPTPAQGPVSIFGDRHGWLTGDAGEVRLTSNGSWTICCDPGTAARLGGLTISAPEGLGVWARQAQHLQVEDCHVTDCAEGIRAEETPAVWILRSEIASCREGGILLRDGSRAVVEDCTIRQHRRGAVVVTADRDSLELRRCLLSGNGGVALRLGGASQVDNCLIIRNQVGVEIAAEHVQLLHLTVADNRSDGIHHAAGADVAIVNSAIVGNRGVGLRSAVGQLTLLSNHLHGNQRGDMEGLPLIDDGKTRDPQFLSAEDYTPGRQSPLLHAGVPTECLADWRGQPRQSGDAPDIGCIERPVATASEYYVRPDGNDRNTGFSPQTAWRTLSHATRSAQPGATVHVGAGEYREDIVSATKGRENAPITFRADLTGAKTGLRGDVILRAAESPWAWRFHHASQTKLYGFTFQSRRDGTAGAVEAIGSDQIALENCRIQGTAHGLLAESSSVSVTDCQFTRIPGQAATASRSQLVVNHCRVLGGHLGFVSLPGSQLVVRGSQLENQTGGGIQNGGKLTLEQTEFTGCGGAALHLVGLDTSLFTWQDSTIRRSPAFALSLVDCFLSWDGKSTAPLTLKDNTGGMSIRGGTVLLSHWNLGTTQQVGFDLDRASVVITDTPVGGIQAAVQIRQGSVVVDRCQMDAGETGVVLDVTGAQAALRNSLITRCAVLLRTHPDESTSDSRIWNCTVVGCGETALDHGSGQCEVRNSILVGEPRSKTAVSIGPNATWSHSHNLWSGFPEAARWEPGPEERWGVPRFAAPDRGDYRLGTGSPAINAGMDAPHVSDRDLTGQTRPQFRAWDLGAFEYTGENGSLRVLRWEEKR